MNAETAGHVGTAQLKQFHMVYIDMWHHPKYYKELRKLRNKLDQAISKLTQRVGLAAYVLVRAPSNKLQATSLKLQATRTAGRKLQATSNKLQAPSRKLQAPRFDHHEKVSRHTNRGAGPR